MSEVSKAWKPVITKEFAGFICVTPGGGVMKCQGALSPLDFLQESYRMQSKNQPGKSGHAACNIDSDLDCNAIFHGICLEKSALQACNAERNNSAIIALAVTRALKQVLSRFRVFASGSVGHLTVSMPAHRGCILSRVLIRTKEFLSQSNPFTTLTNKPRCYSAFLYP